ncbi:MAG TPA: serine/threonine-protein kinase, partial [Kofleriaceae bacterium]|nr:serine/threonine-protein kinase [Kofleriaceae bacterium]
MRDLGDELLRAKVNARLFGGAARDAHDGAPRLGRLVILDRLGAGAMGTVYAAYDPQLDRKVAVKVLHAAGADANARFLREARTLAKLAHPNIVTIYEAGEDAGAVHVVMELATGVPLRAWIAAAERKHDWRDVVRVMREVAAGLAAAHAAGIVHRDVKPENILIGDDRARLVDFGLALDDAERAGDEPVAGTPAYLAPEVLAGGAATAASDQFSFGVTLYEALYGKRPHAAATCAELADAARRAADAPAVDPAVPGWVHAIAKRALAAAPDDRAPSMTAVGSELGRDRRTKRRALAIAAAALVAGGIGGALVMHGSAAPTPAPPSCDGSSRTAEVWSRDRADHVRAALGDAGWRDRAIGSLDELARAWTASYGKVCEATRIRGAQSDRLLELRMRCLDRALGRFDALAAALAASPLDRAARAEASSAILQLPRPERCETIV